MVISVKPLSGFSTFYRYLQGNVPGVSDWKVYSLGNGTLFWISELYWLVIYIISKVQKIWSSLALRSVIFRKVVPLGIGFWLNINKLKWDHFSSKKEPSNNKFNYFITLSLSQSSALIRRWQTIHLMISLVYNAFNSVLPLPV